MRYLILAAMITSGCYPTDASVLEEYTTHQQENLDGGQLEEPVLPDLEELPEREELDPKIEDVSGSSWWIEVKVDDINIERVDIFTENSSQFELKSTYWEYWYLAPPYPIMGNIKFRYISRSGKISFSEMIRWPPKQ